MQKECDLTLENLSQLDFGVLNETFVALRKECVKDMEQRPGDPKPRQVILKLNMTPVTTDGGMLDEVQVECEIDNKLPKRKTKKYSMRSRKNGSLTFQPLSPENPDQLGFDSVQTEETNGGSDD